MHPYQHAEVHPDRAAFVMADTGEQLTYRELDRASNQAANYFRRRGLKPGDRIGFLLRNGPAYPIAYWGAQRSGLMVAPLSTHLKAEEVAYILNDCDAKLLLTSVEVGETASRLAREHEALCPGIETVLATGTPLPGTSSWENAIAACPDTPIPDEVSGYYLVYSSGTTGRPKGIELPFEPGRIEEMGLTEAMSCERLKGYDPVVTFNAAPMYHAAPLVSMLTTQRMGGTAVFLKKFDALRALRAIQDWQVRVAQFVPTMFVRMLALPDDVRASFDISSLSQVIHAAAPCPIEVKRRMLDWFGPIIHEYYSGTEANGQCAITPEEWLRKPGSVGQPKFGRLHICDENGDELPTGSEGLVYFESPREFKYLNDPDKTAKAHNPKHSTWTALGDIGRVDEDGYLFLTDRKDFMIISGGVNIYPRAIEDCLILHPKVADVAVIGIPNAEYGEEVKAIVQPKRWEDASETLSRELIAYAREHISKVSVPRSVDFVEELPRLPTGKLAKHELRRPYLARLNPA
jgi:fatty-acyl-CoA synthase